MLDEPSAGWQCDGRGFAARADAPSDALQSRATISTTPTRAAGESNLNASPDVLIALLSDRRFSVRLGDKRLVGQVIRMVEAVR